jgi:hypothetical protein
MAVIMYGGNTYRVQLRFAPKPDANADPIWRTAVTALVAGSTIDDIQKALVAILGLNPTEPTGTAIAGYYTVGTVAESADVILGGQKNTPVPTDLCEIVGITMAESNPNAVLICSKEV